MYIQLLQVYVQAHVLDEAKKEPDTWWWIKADGCDIVPGVAASTQGVWSGNVDMNDGRVDKQKICACP